MIPARMPEDREKVTLWPVGDRGYLLWARPGESISVGRVGERPSLCLRPETARELAELLPKAAEVAEAALAICLCGHPLEQHTIGTGSATEAANCQARHCACTEFQPR